MASKGAHHVDSWVIREHGSSYLAIFEWTGLFGVVPFFGLVLLVAGNAGRTLLSVRRTGDLSSPAIAAAAIGISGLIHDVSKGQEAAADLHNHLSRQIP